MSRFQRQGALPRTALAVLLSAVPVLAPSQAQAADPPAEVVERFVEAFNRHDVEAQPSPYTEHAGREIKALSPEQVDQLLTGQGMGLALPAELNGYPGPRHVLELAAELDLSEEQRQAVQRVHDAMLEQAQELGRKIVEAERRLDALFAEGEATAETLRPALDHLGVLQAALRHAHLNAHLETKALLTETQVVRYTHLRGYAAEATHHGHQHRHP